MHSHARVRTGRHSVSLRAHTLHKHFYPPPPHKHCYPPLAWGGELQIANLRNFISISPPQTGGEGSHTVALSLP
jgi:hypothetical protein